MYIQLFKCGKYNNICDFVICEPFFLSRKATTLNQQYIITTHYRNYQGQNQIYYSCNTSKREQEPGSLPKNTLWAVDHMIFKTTKLILL